MTASALVFMALIAGIAGTGWQAYRATQAERRSLEKERDAIRSAQKAMAAADESKRSLMKAREAVDRLLTRVAVDLRDMPHMAQTRRALLLDALEFYQGFLEQQRNNPSLRRETAMLHWRVSDIFHELGQIEQSMPHVKEAIRLLKELVHEKPDNQGYRNDLVQRYAVLRSNLMALGLTEERLIATSESIAVAEQLVADFPSVPHYRIEAAKGYLSQSHIYSGLNDMPKTLAGCRSAIAIIEQLMHDFPDEATQALAFEPRCATTPSGSQPNKVRNMEYFPEQGSLEKHSIPGRLACRNLSGCE